MLITAHRAQRDTENMTLIIAHRDGWMVADCGEQAGQYKVPAAIDKIIRTPTNHWLLAVAGDCITSQKLRGQLRVDEDTLETVVRVMEDKDSDRALLGVS